MLKVDALTAQEIDALEGAELLGLLSELYVDMRRLRDARKTARNDKRDAKIALLFEPTDRSKKAKLLEAEAVMDVLAIEYSARQEQIKIIQTQVNTQTRLAR